jgi:Cu(I)/Ag(I) efflux system membrane fusion protein
LEGYLAVQRALADDDTAGAAQAARKLVELLNAARHVGHEGERALWVEADVEILASAQRIAGDTALQAQREAFLPLSGAVGRLVSVYGTAGTPVSLAYCPMAFGNKGATWLQTGTQIANPYFGAQMLRCGEIRREFMSASEHADDE